MDGFLERGDDFRTGLIRISCISLEDRIDVGTGLLAIGCGRVSLPVVVPLH